MLTATRSVSYASLNNDTSVMASTVTPTVDTVYSGIDFTSGGPYPLPRTIDIQLATSAGTYIEGSTITVTGTSYTGVPIVKVFTIEDPDGGEFLSGEFFSTITSIAIQAQNDANGSFTVGLADVFIPNNCVGIRVAASGAVTGFNPDGTSFTYTDIPAGKTFRTPIMQLSSGGTSAGGVTIFLGTQTGAKLD